jgi:tetratricopeptide (TPR) repeat protein
VISVHFMSGIGIQGLRTAAGITFFLLVASPAAADSFGCDDFDRSPIERIAGCTKALLQPSLEPAEKAWWLVYRGFAYDDLAEYSKGEADFKAASAEASPEYRSKAEEMASMDDPVRVDAVVPFGHAFAGHAQAMMKLGKYDTAQSDLKEAQGWYQSEIFDALIEAQNAGLQRRKGDLAAAEAAFKKSIALNPSSDRALLFYAVLLLELGRESEAKPLIEKAAAVDDGDFGFPTLWLFLHGDDREESKHALREYAGSTQEWPAPIARYYLGEIDEAKLLKAAEDGVPAKTREKLCEAHYYIAEVLRIAGRKDEARAHYRATVNTGITWYVEYDLASRWLAKN